MNRRDFNIRLMALGATPLAPALPGAAATAPPAALSGKALMHYPWAARYARVHDACSPERLARAFGISPDIAGELFAKLQFDGVISAPGLTGVARAVNPINWDLQFSPSTAQVSRNAMAKRLRKALTDRRDANPSEPDTPPEDTPALSDTPSTAATETE
ncbi:hypothetical protein N4R57_18460 [Rhodobacteraceae bacterium D3-12]|nr:hypothetical protein N4R57_18460 [Rhodobacteraceae bacterium D3-12]